MPHFHPPVTSSQQAQETPTCVCGTSTRRLPSHVLSDHKGWVLRVEWEAMERKLVSGGHDGLVCLIKGETDRLGRRRVSCLYGRTDPYAG